ncbi:hypothetical protein [Streptomyces ardesiacus]|uniref:Integral membrane protein n=1 Tax=Streptomyces ardesiacus TaxID=285564 RepID=A0ABW8HDH4_9ACTN
MSWRGAAWAGAVCWAVSGAGYGVLAVLDRPELSPAPLICAVLGRWFFVYHRCWRAAVAAGVVGSVVLFGLVDVLRPELGRYGADAVATGAASTAALAVFALVDRVTGRAGGDPAVRRRPWGGRP